MANQSSGSSGPGSGSRRGRRAPTIDLSAEEVKRRAEAAPDAEEPGAAPTEEKTTGAGPSAAGAEERPAPSGGERAEPPGGTRPEQRQEAREAVMPSAFATRAAADSSSSVMGDRPARGRGAAAGLFAAALAGGLIVLAGLVLLGSAGLLPLGRDEAETTTLRNQVTALEQELAATRQAAELEGEDLQDQIADLNERLAALSEAAPAEGGPAEPAATDPALAEELAVLQAALAELRDEIGAASAPAAVGELGERLERLEETAERVAELSNRVEALQAAPREGLAEAVETEVAGIADRLAAVEDSLAQLDQQVQNAASAEALENAQSQLTMLQQTAETELGEVSQRLARLEALAPAVAADAFAAALAAGRPFSAELQAIDAMGGGDPALSELAPYADQGLPDRTQLRRQFSDIAQQIRESEAPPPSNAGPLERLLQSARNVVEVRPAGPQEGESASAVASRIEAALAAGDLARALEEWQDLPPEAQQASQDWAERARAVLAGEALAARLRSDALGQLAGGG